MKIILAFFITFLLCSVCHSQNQNSSTSSPNVILDKVSKKLNSLRNVSYDNTRELNYASENYHNETSWTEYLDFESADKIIGFKYQIDDSTLSQFFSNFFCH